MRKATIILNVLLTIVVVLLLIDEGLPEGGYLLICLLMLITPIITLIYIYLRKDDTSGDTWLPLYFKRKTLEERKRIEEIEGKK